MCFSAMPTSMYSLPYKSRCVTKGAVLYTLTIFLQRVLNENGYTVWIDTAGIRAGQKWRTEIAHGIHVKHHYTVIPIHTGPHCVSQDCRLFVFIMTPRSTNSQYCHDEVATVI